MGNKFPPPSKYVVAGVGCSQAGQQQPIQKPVLPSSKGTCPQRGWGKLFEGAGAVCPRPLAPFSSPSTLLQETPPLVSSESRTEKHQSALVSLTVKWG